MAYCTQSDLEEQISADELEQLTDDTGDGAVDATVIARAIADADAEIDAYLFDRYAVPLSTVPAVIRKLSVDMAIYHLCSRRPVGMPDIRKERYERAMVVLRDIAKGLISVGASTPSPSTSDAPETTLPRSERVFTRGYFSNSSSGTLDYY